MIVIVSVPMLGTAYEFRLNEDKLVSVLIGEIVDAVCKKEMLTPPDDVSGFLLMTKNTKRILTLYKSLESGGVKEGERLVLI